MTPTVWYMPWTIPQLRLSRVVTITSKWQLTMKLSRSLARWDTNMTAVALRSDYSRRVCAPKQGVIRH